MQRASASERAASTARGRGTPDDVVVALGADADDADRDADLALDQLDQRRGPGPAGRGLAHVAQVGAPPRQRLVDRLDPRQHVGAVGVAT